MKASGHFAFTCAANSAMPSVVLSVSTRKCVTPSSRNRSACRMKHSAGVLAPPSGAGPMSPKTSAPKSAAALLAKRQPARSIVSASAVCE